MSQIDWVGDIKRKPFKDIRATKDAVADRKATLCLLLTRALNTIPRELMSGGSVNAVRAYKADREACLKVCANKRSSAHELELALSRMEGHVGVLK